MEEFLFKWEKSYYALFFFVAFFFLEAAFFFFAIIVLEFILFVEIYSRPMLIIAQKNIYFLFLSKKCG